MALGFSINQLVSFILVATFTFTVWHSTFELTKYTIQNWDSLSLSNLLLIIKKLTSSPGLLLLHSYLSVSIIMKILVAVTILVVYFVVQLDAFIRAPYPRRARAIRQGIIRPNAARLTSDFTHEDIIWTLRPPEGTPLWKRFGLRFGSNIIRLEAIVRGRDPPFCLCPKGGQAIIHAVYNGKRIGKFGITTIRGPPDPMIDQSTEDLFKIKLNGRSVGAAAVIYMFVEPMHRKHGLGKLALEVISLIHALQGCDFTMMVCDDNGSGKLIEWYESNGYKQAPKLQALLGSPNKEFGTTMIAPTQRLVNPACRLKWW